MQQEQKPKLKEVFLGNTGVLVSELCLGAMTFGTTETNNWGMPVCNEADSIKLLETYQAYGGNFIDTADVYGDSEIVLGNWLAKQGPAKRREFVIATKVRLTNGKGPNDRGSSRKHIMEGVESSLARLQTPYIDLYQLHSWDNGTPLKETFSALNDLVRAGKVHYIGVSNFVGWQLQKAIDLCEYMGLAPVITLQSQYSLLTRHLEWENIPICKNEGLALLPWSPLKGGWLSGRYQRPTGEQKPSIDGRLQWAQNANWKETDFESNNSEATWKVIDTLNALVKETGRTHSQVALRWLLQKGEEYKVPVIPIIGARKVEHLVDNLGAIGWQLSKEQMAALNTVSDNPKVYPWSLGSQGDRARN